MIPAMVKRWGKSPPGTVATRYAARLMGCKAMYIGAWYKLSTVRGHNELLAHSRGVGCSSAEAKRGTT